MNILRTLNIEDSFDGSFIRQFELDEIIRLDFIDYLGELGGQVKLVTPSPNAIFTVICPGKFTLKGMENSRSIRVIIEHKDAKKTFDEIVNHINKYSYFLDEE